MGWILTIIIGGILGWLASKVMKTDAQQGIILNIVVGVVGAALAGFLLSPLLGIPTINAANFSIGGLLISFVGALVLLAIVNFFRRGRVRWKRLRLCARQDCAAVSVENRRSWIDLFLFTIVFLVRLPEAAL